MSMFADVLDSHSIKDLVKDTSLEDNTIHNNIVIGGNVFVVGRTIKAKKFKFDTTESNCFSVVIKQLAENGYVEGEDFMVDNQTTSLIYDVRIEDIIKELVFSNNL